MESRLNLPRFLWKKPGYPSIDKCGSSSLELAYRSLCLSYRRVLLLRHSLPSALSRLAILPNGPGIAITIAGRRTVFRLVCHYYQRRFLFLALLAPSMSASLSLRQPDKTEKFCFFLPRADRLG